MDKCMHYWDIAEWTNVFVFENIVCSYFRNSSFAWSPSLESDSITITSSFDLSSFSLEQSIDQTIDRSITQSFYTHSHAVSSAVLVCVYADSDVCVCCVWHVSVPRHQSKRWTHAYIPEIRLWLWL